MFASTTGTQQPAQMQDYVTARNSYSGAVFAAMGNHECNGFTDSNCLFQRACRAAEPVGVSEGRIGFAVFNEALTLEQLGQVYSKPTAGPAPRGPVAPLMTK